MNCPKCRSIAMMPETYESTQIDRCPECQGALFESAAIEKMLGESMGSAVDLKAYTPLSREQDRHPAHCTRCDLEMEQYLGPAKLRIDRCPKCLAVFLDQGELGTLLGAGAKSV
ncbi:MAG TPA: zf-TFIIB domain-containing protein [Myxococcales bacterium]|jgi:Zn-finger nucleic acid-binding protein